MKIQSHIARCFAQLIFYVIRCITSVDKVILWQIALNLLNHSKVTRIREQKEFVICLPFTIILMSALIMIISVSVNFTSLESVVVLAQESNQIRISENTAIENNSSNVTQLSTRSAANDMNDTIQSSNQEPSKDDDHSIKVITLVTEE